MFIIISFLQIFGFNPDNFENVIVHPIENGDSFIYEVTQRKAEQCIFCGSKNVYVHDHRKRRFVMRFDGKKTELIVRECRCKCMNCKRTFTPKLDGIPRYAKTTNQVYQAIVSDCKKKYSLAEIGRKYSLTSARIIQIFDKEFPVVDRLRLPKVLCIDEIKFYTSEFTKYIAVLSDFETGDIVDVIESRQIEYLRKYFSSISPNELNNVKYIISDMYEGFNRISLIYFNKATHVIDLFHVVEDLTRAVNKIRTEVMKNALESGEKNFMKKHWKLFLMRKEKIPNKYYTYEKTNVEKHYDSWIGSCLALDKNFYNAYQCLQEMFKYSRYSTYDEGKRHLIRIIELLKAYLHPELIRVAETYEKNMVGIINCLDKKSRPFRYTTGIAECINNHIKTLIKICYGCYNFDRFRRRILLISRCNKMNRNKKEEE